MANLKSLTLETQPTGSGVSAPATEDNHLIRKKQFDDAVNPLVSKSHDTVTKADTNSVQITVSGAQVISAAVRRKLLSLAVSEGLLNETADGLSVKLGEGANDAASGAWVKEIEEDVAGFLSALAGKAPLTHDHTIAQVTGLQSALDGKSALGHTHANATYSVSGFMSAMDKMNLDSLMAIGNTNFSQLIGDSESTQIDVIHSKGTRNLIVQMYSVITGELVTTDTSIMDENTVRFLFSEAPESGEYRVVIRA